MSRTVLAPLSLALLLAGCDGGSEPTDPLVLDSPTEASTPVVHSTPPEPTCGPVELCTRSTQECGYNVPVETCAAWYDDPGHCADMDAYVACNCDCLGEDTCDAYYACGELCFADHC